MDSTDKLLEQRSQSWGDPIETHERIAQVWSAILNVKVSAVQVALMMEGLKIVRATLNPEDPDSFEDAQGYSRIAEKIMGHDEHARLKREADEQFAFLQRKHRQDIMNAKDVAALREKLIGGNKPESPN